MTEEGLIEAAEFGILDSFVNLHLPKGYYFNQ